jgi:integrase
MDQSTISYVAPSLPHHPLPTKSTCSITAEHEFSDAARRWMDSRSVNVMPGARSARYIRKNTAESYSQYIRSLELFFAGHKLGDIRAGNLTAYQEARICGSDPFIRYRRPQDAKDKMQGGVLIPAKGKTPCPVKPKKVNQELGLLQHIMKRANCWSGEMEELYQPLLDDEDEVPRALSLEEERRWLEVARSQTRWDVIYWYSILAFDTCMSTDEIRGLRLGDINTIQRVVTVARKTAKNGHRARTIELVGGDVLWAVERLLSVASHHGAIDPQHYLFPWRVKINLFDPTRPMSESGIKVAWNEVRQHSGLKWFRQYDCRHTAITRLAEAGVPTDVIMSRAGHVSEKMRRHYTHISQASQRKWLEHSQIYHHIAPEVPRGASPYARFNSYTSGQAIA